ncbi:TetR/AcrR family transcriptional regulator [Streptomyces thermodiastaticus]|jgi:AcrR family transcriptional regulator|uniref:TetR/AcrR family transcriptional regulator n=1 Tax=Streptomyces thermodiastaticus TaxID=44061 RepID=UPI00167442B4|nr:TetR/AcrR family transcriptional regulator [Streptomyces thermodiastaticus]MCE7549880.1 TetR/AcrR family transcriptional regulator [Streptomyces thermodiastaticus]
MMPAARDLLLDAAYAALTRRPWYAVRMVDVAAAAGVSRQTLYNEFGTKDGLARALVEREAAAFLDGVDRALAGGSDPHARLTALVEWTAAAARDNVLVKALLTGCWDSWLPRVEPAAAQLAAVPAGDRGGGRPLSPAGVLAQVRDRAVAALSAPGTPAPDIADLAGTCELVVRLGLSCVAAPPGEHGADDLVRAVLRRCRPD